jgi:prevent-host-death family protein
MKTISVQQAARDFEEYSKLAHDGQRILVTRNGKPWIVLVPPTVAAPTDPNSKTLQWPDYTARLAPFYPEPVAGPTAAELLAQDKEDRF